MKIYTKNGDKGESYLLGGKKVKKNDLRLMSYGSIDELSSYLGLLRSLKIKQEYQDEIIIIQNKLFLIGSILANYPANKKIELAEITDRDILNLEKSIDKKEAYLPKLNQFIIPGGSQSSATCHVARSICRRAERIVVGLAETEQVHGNILKYLNRLSDYLFMLARTLAIDDNVEELKVGS